MKLTRPKTIIFILINMGFFVHIGCTKTHSQLSDKLAANDSFYNNNDSLCGYSSVITTQPIATMPTHRTQNKAPKPPFTLEQCIKIALSNNPDIGTGYFNILSARAQQEIAEGKRWPEIRIQSDYKHHFDDQRLIQPRYPGEPGVWDNDILSGDIIFKMPIFTSGRITNEIKAAKLIKESSQYQLARTREELIFNISSVFYKILAQKHIISSLKFSKKALSTHRRRIKNMIDVQRAAKVDLLRIEVRLANINQRIVAEKNALSILRRILVNLLGLRDNIEKMRIKGKLELTQITPNLPQSIKLAYKQRADYIAMTKHIDAQEYQIKVAKAGHWPIISFQASYGFRSALNPSTRPSTEEQTEDVGFFGVIADWPIFEGGRIDARIRNERAKLDSLREQLRKLKLKIQLDVESAILNITSAKERIQATQMSIAQAKESLRIEREKYTEGKGSITDVLDAQDALLNAQTAYYYALSDYNIAIAQWRCAIGEEK